jgi:hypothetical protein
MMKQVGIVALALGCAACVSMGTNYDPTVVSSIQPGATEAEVIARLGPPTSRTAVADGTTQLMWMHSRGDALGRASARIATLEFRDGRFVRVVVTNETNIR